MIDPKSVFPLRGKLYGEVVLDDKVSPGGIYLADSLKSQPVTRVRIIRKGLPKIGAKGKEIHINAWPGDVVHIKKQIHSPNEIRQFEKAEEKLKTYIFLKFDDVIAIERGPETVQPRSNHL